jgi:hypothetical protein
VYIRKSPEEKRARRSQAFTRIPWSGGGRGDDEAHCKERYSSNYSTCPMGKGRKGTKNKCMSSAIMLVILQEAQTRKISV